MVRTAPCSDDVGTLTQEIDAVRVRVQRSPAADETALPPEAEAHYALALAALETARRHMTLAHYCAMQGR